MGNHALFAAMTAAVIAISACSTPYQAGIDSFGGGYEEHEIADGQWHIAIRGNSYTSFAQLQQYFFRRAGELCGQYQVVSLSEETVNYGLAGPKPVVSGIVGCE